jgi:fatty acid CoA ligase FadD36
MFLSSLTGSGSRDIADAVTIGDVSSSRGELLEAACAFAAALPDGGPVAVNATATMETVVAVTGCLLSGVPFVPVPPDSGPAEREHIITNSKATCWAGEAPADVPLPVIVAGAGRGALPRVQPASPDELAMIMYTSGTTGAPKGVRLSHRALASGVDALAEAWQWSGDDTVVHGLPLFHVHGLVLGVLASLRIGSRVVHTGRPFPANYAQARGTMYFGVPTVWSRIAADPQAARALSHARLLVSGSAPLPQPVFERMTALTGVSPVERYGMTETMITLSTRADGERRPGWVGLPLQGVETRLCAEEDDTTTHQGERIGRLEVRGPMLFDGYLDLPQATAASWTEDGWFDTGDVAACDPEGFHRIVGRESTDIIKSGGYKIGAGEVETALLSHPAVQEAAVIGIPDGDLGQRVVAFVVAESAARPDSLSASLIDFVAESLSRHKRPREVVFVDTLPRNPMGKVQKALLQR